MDRVTSRGRRTPPAAQTTRHVVTGTAVQVRNAMATLADRGELVSYGRPAVVPGRPGHVRIELVTTAQVPPAAQGVRARLLRTARWGRPRTVTVVIVSTGTAVLAAAIWLVASLVAWVAVHFALIVGAALVAVVVAMLVGNSRGGPGCRCC